MAIFHRCAFCHKPARNYAAQSVDQGKTVTYVWACDGHVSGWNEDGDWDAPVCVPARFVREGDYLDLENDPYADPSGENIMFQSEYALVASVERETPDCVAIGIDGFDIVGFPTDHMVRIQV